MLKSETAHDPTRTQVDASLAAAQRRHANDPDRAELIARTRRFKSSWIELAESLTDCRQHERFRKWGFKSFNDYYQKELHLKESTVDKLTGSFAFLRKSAPEVLERDGVNDNIPSWQSIDFLRRAEEAAQNGKVSEETVAEVRKAVVDDNMPLPKITRLFRETLFPAEPGAEEKKRLKEAGKTARKLGDLIAGLREVNLVPETVIVQVEQALAALLRALPVEPVEAEKEEPQAGVKAA